ncbi:hypothetical protein PILCRDRAFT_87227 [Piloderma croceum F 1598]|uniref:Uncharacterized protein n=1 Tax=Piloderma croceum (strain F 1598) TaxID=765440 RepID=A0A0C3FLD4_PILCF|nr:hypothetical protein PILCRDRAFT_87227 [Piloderma croceum F 1598]
MNPVFFSLVFAAVAFGQSLTINTPSNPVECQPTQLTWTGGSPPYFLSIFPGGEPTGTALEDLGQQNATQFTWIADLAAGTSCGFSLKDSTGLLAQSGTVTIQAGTSTSCLKSGGGSTSGGSSSSSASSPAGTTPATTPATSPAATTKAATTTATTPASSHAGSSSGGSTPTGASGSSSTGAASANMANMGAAGVFGAAIMAILA